MKVKATVSSLALLLLTTGPVFANALTYTAPAGEQGGKFTGELTLARIGTVALPDGLLKFSDDEMLVEAVPDWLFDREQVLRGVIVRAEVASQQNSSIVAGLVFFVDGTWLPNLGPRRTVDEIVTNAGETILGRITGRSGQAFSVQPEQGGNRKVNFSDIRSIKSPRAFAFNISTPSARLSPTDNSFSFDSNMITLKPSSDQAHIASAKAKVPRSTLAGADPGVSDRAVNTFIALDIFSEIVPAIAIPLVLNPITQRHAIKQISNSLNTQLGLPAQ